MPKLFVKIYYSIVAVLVAIVVTNHYIAAVPYYVNIGRMLAFILAAGYMVFIYNEVKRGHVFVRRLKIYREYSPIWFYIVIIFKTIVFTALAICMMLLLTGVYQ